MADNEVGRELATNELKPGTVVIIAPPGGHNLLLTMWVTDVEATTATFSAFADGRIWHIANSIRDNHLVDDKGRVVRVFEYLGKI